MQRVLAADALLLCKKVKHNVMKKISFQLFCSLATSGPFSWLRTHTFKD